MLHQKRLRFFLQRSPFFVITPALIYDETECSCGNPDCTGGWALVISWGGWDLGFAVRNKTGRSA